MFVSYGSLDQVLSVTATYSGVPGKTLTYDYSPDGSRASLGTPVGTFNYYYNAAAQPTSLSNPFSETTNWTYQTSGWLATQTLSNGTATTYGYTALGQLQSLVNRDSMTNILAQFTSMVHDGAGNRVSLTASVTGSTQLSGAICYGYDTKGQLTSETRMFTVGSSRDLGTIWQEIQPP